MINVALFRDMDKLRITTVGDVVSRYSLISEAAREELAFLLDTVTSKDFKIMSAGDVASISWPKHDLVITKKQNNKISDTVTYNSEKKKADIEECYGCLAIAISGELVCLIPANLIK